MTYIWDMCRELYDYTHTIWLFHFCVFLCRAEIIPVISPKGHSSNCKYVKIWYFSYYYMYYLYNSAQFYIHLKLDKPKSSCALKNIIPVLSVLQCYTSNFLSTKFKFCSSSHHFFRYFFKRFSNKDTNITWWYLTILKAVKFARVQLFLGVPVDIKFSFCLLHISRKIYNSYTVCCTNDGI